MPRSIQEILDHADELARRFEGYEPADGDQRPVEEYLLQRAAVGASPKRVTDRRSRVGRTQRRDSVEQDR